MLNTAVSPGASSCDRGYVSASSGCTPAFAPELAAPPPPRSAEDEAADVSSDAEDEPEPSRFVDELPLCASSCEDEPAGVPRRDCDGDRPSALPPRAEPLPLLEPAESGPPRMRSTRMCESNGFDTTRNWRPAEPTHCAGNTRAHAPPALAAAAAAAAAEDEPLLPRRPPAPVLLEVLELERDEAETAAAAAAVAACVARTILASLSLGSGAQQSLRSACVDGPSFSTGRRTPSAAAAAAPVMPGNGCACVGCAARASSEPRPGGSTLQSGLPEPLPEALFSDEWRAAKTYCGKDNRRKWSE